MTSPAGEGEAMTATETTVYVVHTPRGFTESFDRQTIETLERLGLIEHERDGYALEDGAGRGVGPLHRYYREHSATPMKSVFTVAELRGPESQ